MSTRAASLVPDALPVERLDALFAGLAELTGQRNAIDGRIVDIVAEIDRDGLCGMTGARSLAALVAWKTAAAPATAHTYAVVAQRVEQFPRCVAGLRAGRFSLDQVGTIAGRAADGSDEHYAVLAESASVRQLRTAIGFEPPRAEEKPPVRDRFIAQDVGEQFTSWRIRLPAVEAATRC